jgi:oxalate decarboxylase/phosphoglucose isomerase-like protein (cupin superfamily)
MIVMKKPIVIKASEVEKTTPPAVGKEAGWMQRIAYPSDSMLTKGVFLGVCEINPGYCVHRWHEHTTDQAAGYEVTYPEGFEEIYYMVNGTATIQWKTNKGEILEEQVSAGDAVYFPEGVAEHQLLNNGKEKMFVVFCGNLPPQVKMKAID